MYLLDEMLIRLIGDGSSYEAMVNNAIGSTNSLASSVSRNSAQIGGLTSVLTNFGSQAQSVLGGLAATLGIGGAISTAFAAIGKAADTESIEIAFKSLIGDAQLAQKTLGDLRQFAVSTPFELPQILEAAKSMLAYGQSAETIVPTMQRLGDVASALNIPLSSLTYLYGTLKSSGRVMTVDMRQFANRGIPIWLELAKVLGMVSKETRELTGAQSAQLQQMVSKGQVNFEMIEKAFIGMTSEGGRFFKMMEDQSGTFNGLVSNLKDSIGLLFADVGKQIIEGMDLKRIVLEVRNAAQAFVDWFKAMDPETKKFLFTMLATATAVATLIGAFMTLQSLITTVVSLISAAGPFGIAIAAVGLAVGLWIDSVGGFGKALDIAKEKLAFIWELVAPIKQALVELGTTVMESLRRAFTVVSEVARATFGAMMGDSTMTWQQMVDDVADMVLKIEYWVLKLQKDFFDVFRAIGQHAGVALVVIVKGFEMAARQMMIALKVVDKALELANKLGPLNPLNAFGLAGARVDFGQMDDALKDLPDTFEEFKKMREEARKAVKGDTGLLTDDVMKKEQKKGEEMGKQVGGAIKKGMMQELRLLDSILFGSADYFRRLDDYLTSLNVKATKVGVAAVGAAAVGAGGGGLVPAAAMVPAPVPTGGGLGETNGLLREIRDILRGAGQGQQPKIELDGADLEPAF